MTMYCYACNIHREYIEIFYDSCLSCKPLSFLRSTEIVQKKCFYGRRRSYNLRNFERRRKYFCLYFLRRKFPCFCTPQVSRGRPSFAQEHKNILWSWMCFMQRSKEIFPFCLIPLLFLFFTFSIEKSVDRWKEYSALFCQLPKVTHTHIHMYV